MPQFWLHGLEFESETAIRELFEKGWSMFFYKYNTQSFAPDSVSWVVVTPVSIPDFIGCVSNNLCMKVKSSKLGKIYIL